MSTTQNLSFPAEWVPDPEDERLHEPVGDASLPWKETWYFSLRDEASDQTINMHVTVSANRSPSTRVGVSLAQGNRWLTEVRRDEGDNDADGFGNGVGRVDLRRLTGGAGHELRLSGRLSEGAAFDIAVTGVHYASLWNTMFKAFYPTGEQGHSYSHYEQLVAGEGWIQFDGEPQRAFSGTGWRDRGWGRRKTEKTFTSGFDLVGAVLPDGSTFSMISTRSIEVAADAPMPAAGWRSAEGVLTPLVSGLYYKDAMAYPTRLELEFLDGYKLSAQTVRLGPSIPTNWHDAEPEDAGVAINLRDYYVVMADHNGREFTCFSNYGDIHKVDVLRHAEIKYERPAAA